MKFEIPIIEFDRILSFDIISASSESVTTTNNKIHTDPNGDIWVGPY